MRLSSRAPVLSHRGFTLLELVTVLLLLGILSVYIAPRFSSRDGYAEYAARDQYISAFRLAQQRAMYDHGGDCYSVNIDASGFGSQREDDYFGPVGEVSFSGDLDGQSITPAAPIYFDGLGNAFTGSCSGAATSSPLLLTVEPSGIQIEIYATGYIRAI